MSIEIGESIFEALEAYSLIDSYHVENATLSPKNAAKARAKIMKAALQLVGEMENDKDSDEWYEQTLDEWQGETGYINRLAETSLRQKSPGWLFDFVTQIRRAGWELGYLQAGRQGKPEPADADTAQVRRMIE